MTPQIYSPVAHAPHANDFSDLKAENVKDEIIENAQDTMTLLDSYVDDLDVNNLDKNRLKTMLKGLYVEASNMEI